MTCNSLSLCGSMVNPTTPREIANERNSLRRSLSSKDLCGQARMRRSYSDNHLCYSTNQTQASATQPELKASRSIGIFNFQLPGSVIPKALRSFLFDLETSKEMNIEENSSDRDEEEMEQDKKKTNWIERLLEIRSQWIEKQLKGDDIGSSNNCNEDGCDDGCEVDYGDEEEKDGKVSVDRESFSQLLRHVSSSDIKLFSQLAFLCNMAYVIPEIKAKDLRRYYGLDFVTSSLEKKAEAEAINAKFDQDSTIITPIASRDSKPIALESQTSEQKRLPRPSVAYEIAASAATFIQSRANDLLSVSSEHPQDDSGVVLSGEKDNPKVVDDSLPRVYKSEVAAYMAASTMTAVVAAGEQSKQEAAKNLQSLHSSLCEWFVCDDSSTYTRCFVIQGSDSLASWQANLLFEPTKFEGTEVLVHRGIYEASKGIYDHFIPEIMEHLDTYGEQARLQFTGHSLGGSLSLLVSLMLLTRKVVKPSCLLPVVTFGSPFVFCGGQSILDELGLDESHVRCVMMHRDIVPRAFSCNYPNHVAHLLRRLNGIFRRHPCLNKNKLLYSPMGKIFILQPDEKSSPAHPLLPPGSALYTFEAAKCKSAQNAFRAFLNSPHPIETLSDLTAYGSDGTILRDHDSNNYLKAVNQIIRQHTKIVRKEIKQRNLLWPLLTSQSPHAWSHEHIGEGKRLITKELMSSV